MSTITIMILIPFILASLFPYFEAQTLSSTFANQGQWNLVQPSVGISAMHMQLLHNDKIIMFDRTDFGHSYLPLSNGRCRMDPNDIALKVDCSAHSVLYDVPTNTLRPLMIQTDTWCSSGSVLPNGTLIQTGGYNDGERSIRMFTPCFDETCDWVEFPGLLSQRRWYATNQILPDARVIVVGGRRQFNYEFLPKTPSPNSSPSSIPLNFLQQTSDRSENNLYPFVHPRTRTWHTLMNHKQKVIPRRRNLRRGRPYHGGIISLAGQIRHPTQLQHHHPLILSKRVSSKRRCHDPNRNLTHRSIIRHRECDITKNPIPQHIVVSNIPNYWPHRSEIRR